MRYQSFVLCVLFVSLAVYSECFKFRSRGGGRSRSSGSSYGGSRHTASKPSHSIWGSSSSSQSKPASKPFSWGSMFGSKPAVVPSPKTTSNVASGVAIGTGVGSISHGSHYGISGRDHEVRRGFSENTATRAENKHAYPPSSLSGNGATNKLTPYPPSPGLSGDGAATKHTYGHSQSGLSGNGVMNSNPAYPPSSGMSGNRAGDNRPSYPQSPGLSGNGILHTGANNPAYPPSSGMSGSGANNQFYPNSPGLSGNGATGKINHQQPMFNQQQTPQNVPGNYHPNNPGYIPNNNNYQPPHQQTHTFNNYNNGASNIGGGFNGHGHLNNQPQQVHHHYYGQPAYASPQHVYVTEYRNSGSRFSDILTGLALYNMMRSNNHHYHDHYYYDDYYRNRYHSPSSSTYNSSPTYNTNNYNTPPNGAKPQDVAVCSLKIKEDKKIQIVKVPCEIVSTFTEGSKTENGTNNHLPICDVLSNLTISGPKATIANTSILMNTDTEGINATSSNRSQSSNLTIPVQLTEASQINATNAPPGNNVTLASTVTQPNTANESASIVNIVKSTEGTPITNNVTVNTSSPTTTIATPVNVTVENSTNTNATFAATANKTKQTPCINPTDPLDVKGPALNGTSMECSVIIKTKEKYLSHDIDCKVLMEHSKLPEPQSVGAAGVAVPPSSSSTTEAALMPSKDKLKSWLEKPPWWLAAFISI